MSELTVFDPVITLVAKSIQGRDATFEESTIIDSAWINAESSIRAMAWLSREGKTWKHLKDKDGNAFTSFEQYGKERFGYEKTALYQLVSAYEIQITLGFSAMAEKEIPERQLRHLSKVPDDIKKQIWDQVNEENKVVTAKLIEEAVTVYKDLVKQESIEKEIALTQKDEWRKQSLAERDAKREFEAELLRVKESKMEIVYVDDSKKVSEELKQELVRAKEKIKEIQKEKIEAVKKTRENIASGMEKTFKDLQARETAQMSRIDYLQKELNRLDNISIAGSSHRKAQDSYKKGLVECAIALMVFDDYPPNDKQAAIWKKLLSDTQLMLNAQDLDSYQPPNDYLQQPE
jgi:hypothetical protein